MGITYNTSILRISYEEFSHFFHFMKQEMCRGDITFLWTIVQEEKSVCCYYRIMFCFGDQITLNLALNNRPAV